MKRRLACSIVLLFVLLTSKAQFSRYIIQFTDKASSPFSTSNPGAFLSQRAIDRRARYHISIDSADLPVTPRYIDSVRSSGAVTVLNASKWLNSVSIQTTDALALDHISHLPFVKSVSPIALRKAGIKDKFQVEKAEQNLGRKMKEESFFNYGQSFQQVHIHHGEFLHDIGLRGQGMVLGMLDAGFFRYTTLQAFDSVNLNHQVLGVYDFVAKDNSVVEDDAHGMECFSTIASNIPGSFVGTAPKASFYLFRTEDVSSEYPIEEHNWVCGAERIDSAGGDVISTSLGYSEFDNPAFNHTYADMNGRKTMAAIGAVMAARKGILVLVAAGNEGNTTWHYITTPADADSVLAVGAVRADSVVAAFSSFGPSSDGRVKPDVASVGLGTVIESPNNSVTTGNGTSFATPNLAGLATCLWQGFPELDNIKILRAIQQAGSIYTQPDVRIGYGIPDMKKAFLTLVKDFARASASASGCIVAVRWTSKDVSSMQYDIERKLAGDPAFTKIGSVRGSDTILATHSYQFNDSLVNVQAGQIQYRIRQVIDTSRAAFTAGYLDTVNLVLAAPCIVAGSATTLLLIPNPASDHAVLRIVTPNNTQHFTIHVFDSKGALVNTIETVGQAGTTNITIPLVHYARGKYYVEVFADGVLLGTRKLVRL